jgi:hypothetical protein
MIIKLRAVLSLIIFGILLTVSIYSGWKQFSQARILAARVQVEGDEMMEWSERLERIIPRLPTQGPIGYLSERDIHGLAFSPTDQQEEFTMTQFTLAPRILVIGSGYDHVVGNFAGLTPEELQTHVSSMNLIVRAAYPGGIFLLERIQP